MAGYSALGYGTYSLTMNEAGAYCEQMNDYLIIEYPDGKMIKTSAIHQSPVNFGVFVDEQVYVYRTKNNPTIKILLPEDASLKTCHIN